MNQYKPNPTFDVEQNNDAATKQVLGQVADGIAEYARHRMGGGFMRSGERTYARGTQVFSGPGWHLLEFGAIHTTPRGMFRAAVVAAGAHLDESHRT